MIFLHIQIFRQELYIHPCMLLNSNHCYVLQLVGMSDRPWNATLNHAKTCDMGQKCYVFKTVGCDITFNPIGEVLAARIRDQTFALQELHPHQQVTYNNHIDLYMVTEFICSLDLSEFLNDIFLYDRCSQIKRSSM